MKQNKNQKSTFDSYTIVEDIVTHVLKDYGYSSYVIQKTIEDINRRDDSHKIIVKDSKPIVPDDVWDNNGNNIDKVINYLISLKEKGYTDIVDTSDQYDPYSYFEVQCNRLENNEEYYKRISRLATEHANYLANKEMLKDELEKQIKKKVEELEGLKNEISKLNFN
ncbi:hypothetical protein J6O48_14120 [bacterium]|nr:hypothetical protein [bacterium]